MKIPAVTMFQGGKGFARGQFDFPRGIAADRSGNILVADTNNGRIQKFSPAGVFLSMLGSPGHGPGELTDPNGIAVDSKGNVYVADVGNHRVQKLSPEGQFIAQWRGPAPGFYGPRDIWITPDDFATSRSTISGSSSSTRMGGSRRGVSKAGRRPVHEPTAVAVDNKRDRVMRLIHATAGFRLDTTESS
jgi:DNA-binding beta-propeller fold protein YncE